MNAGNKSRGQADGFLLDALGKTLSIKDVDGNSMLSIILEKLSKEDESFMEFKKEFEPCYASLKFPIDDLKRDLEKAQRDLKTSKSQLDMIMKVDPDAEDSPFAK